MDLVDPDLTRNEPNEKNSRLSDLLDGRWSQQNLKTVEFRLESGSTTYGRWYATLEEA